MNGVKIVTIGGGSSYTPELVEGFINRYNTLPVKELWLVDIEEGNAAGLKNCQLVELIKKQTYISNLKAKYFLGKFILPFLALYLSKLAK